jgi:proline dehydrogenase
MQAIKHLLDDALEKFQQGKAELALDLLARAQANHELKGGSGLHQDVQDSLKDHAEDLATLEAKDIEHESERVSYISVYSDRYFDNLKTRLMDDAGYYAACGILNI